MPICPNCRHENPAGNRFCGECATPLTHASTLQAEERRMVTVLFCDLVGFTAASDKADPEDVKARLRPFHTAVKRQIEGFGGTLDKFIGDACLGVFGSPVAHEDDPERAVRAALAIKDAIARLNDADPSLGLAVRQGIDTGEAVVAFGTGPQIGESVTGDVVNTASRLQGAAPVNGVAVGEGTWEATKDVFDYEVLEPVTLKGKAAPVRIFNARSARSRFGSDFTRRLTTALVGRELERTLLTGTFERTTSDRSVQLVTVVGEPGVGKSRLVAELGAYVEDRPGLVRWRQGRCLPYGDAVTFWALREIVKAEARILETDSPEVAASKIDAVVPDAHPDASWLRQRLRPLVGLEAPQAAREENFAAWRAFLELLAEGRPCIFVFEDLHWADDALLIFIEHLAGHAEGVPMLLVGTARPELFERSPAWTATNRNVTRVNLSPLSEAETARLIGNLLGQAVLPAEVQSAILSRAGGNPLYAEEFVRLLKDRGILSMLGATWSIRPDAEIPVPSGVHGLIAARLDALRPAHKRLLQDASVIGNVFWLGAVAEMGEQDPEGVQDAVDQLSSKQLVRRASAPSMEGQVEYAFSHALVRDVVYGEIPRALRADKHRRAAAWIERVSKERVDDHAEILAAHYSVALQLATAAEVPNAEGLRSKALHHLTLAGDRAMAIDVEAAERHYSRALGMVREGHPLRADLLARHAEALRQRGRFHDAARAYEDAIEAFRARGDTAAMAVTMGRQQVVLWRLGDPRSGAVSADALAMLERLGPSSELVQALADQAGRSFVLGENPETVALADRAISLAGELGLPEPARALGFRGGARVYLGDPEGVQDMRRALEAAEAQGLGREVALLYNNLGEALWSIDGPRAWLDTLREGAAFAERRGIEEFVLALTTGTLEALVDLGSHGEALAIADKLVPRLEGAEDVFDLIAARSCQARVLTRRGEHANAGPLAEWAMERARELADPQAIAQACPTAAAARLGVGDTLGAVALLSELDATVDVRDTPNYPRSLADAARAAIAAGDADLAARLADGVEARYRMHEHALLSVRALLAEHRRQHTEARELYAEAAVRWEGFEMRWEEAQALLGQGRCLLAFGRRAESFGVLRRAREILASLDAMPSMAETDELLARSTALTSEA